jgi:hypothetical protein
MRHSTTSFPLLDTSQQIGERARFFQDMAGTCALIWPARSGCRGWGEVHEVHDVSRKSAAPVASALSRAPAEALRRGVTGGEWGKAGHPQGRSAAILHCNRSFYVPRDGTAEGWGGGPGRKRRGRGGAAEEVHAEARRRREARRREEAFTRRRDGVTQWKGIATAFACSGFRCGAQLDR